MPDILTKRTLAALMLALCSNAALADRAFADSTCAPAASDLPILGAIEMLKVAEAPLTLDARVDTGADISSMDARNICEYQCNGQNWVRFELVERSTLCTQTINAPVTRHVKIKRHGITAQCRPVIALPVTLGQQRATTEFTLTDRSNFAQSVLLGRSYLKGRAIIDISRDYLAGKPS